MLDAETREIYDRPIQSSLDPADALEEPPHVQVRGSRAELLGLLRRLLTDLADWPFSSPTRCGCLTVPAPSPS